MAKEKPPIVRVKDDTVIIDLPDQIWADRTYLTSESKTGTSACVVADNTGLSQNDLVCIGEYGAQKTEIVQINAAVTRGTSTAVTTSKVFDHSIGDPVTKILYDQIEIYGSTSATDTSPTIIGSAVTIDVSKGFTAIILGTTFAYYYARFKNSVTSAYSSYSTAVAATGYERDTLADIVKIALRRTQSEVTENGQINSDDLVSAFNEWQDWVFESKRDWSFLRSAEPQYIQLRQGTQEYALASDIQDDFLGQSIIAITLTHGQELTYQDPEEFFSQTMRGVPKDYLSAQITIASTSAVMTNSSGDFEESGKLYIGPEELNYTTNTESTKTISGMDNPSQTHAAGAEVFGAVSRGLPRFFTVYNSKLHIWPLVSSDNEYQMMRVWYWKKFTDASEIADTTIVPFKNSCIYYLMSCLEQLKGDPNNKADVYMQKAKVSKFEALQKELSERHVQVKTFPKHY